MTLKLKVELSCREDNHEKKYHGLLMDRNIIVKDENFLPGADKVTHINFTSDYSEVYDDVSNGVVNTRLRYPENSGQKGAYYVYCKLSWFERQLLNHIEHKALYQKEPIQFYVLLFTLFGTILGLYRDFLIYPNSTDTKIGNQNNEIIIPQLSNEDIIQKLDSIKIYSDTLEIREQ